MYFLQAAIEKRGPWSPSLVTRNRGLHKLLDRGCSRCTAPRPSPTDLTQQSKFCGACLAGGQLRLSPRLSVVPAFDPAKQRRTRPPAAAKICHPSTRILTGNAHRDTPLRYRLSSQATRTPVSPHPPSPSAPAADTTSYRTVAMGVACSACCGGTPSLPPPCHTQQHLI